MTQVKKEGGSAFCNEQKLGAELLKSQLLNQFRMFQVKQRKLKDLKIGFVEKSRLLQVKVLLSSDFFFGKILISLGSGFALLPLTKNKSFKCNTAAAAFFISTKFDFLKLCDFKKAADTFPPDALNI